jgi:septin family protein
VNVLLIIAKADTYTHDELYSLKELLRRQTHDEAIKLYQFPPSGLDHSSVFGDQSIQVSAFPCSLISINAVGRGRRKACSTVGVVRTICDRDKQRQNRR